MIIDFHTHRYPADSSIFAIVNLPLPLPELVVTGENLRFSSGIHPWNLVDLSIREIDAMLDELEYAAEAGNLDVIGECGLDQTISSSLDKQIIVFEHQIGLAEKYQLPLMIHCVKAYSELIAVCKTFSTRLPWIIHGFNGNVQQLEQLLKYDNFLFSFGPALLKQPDKFDPLLRMVPLSHLLLETDDSDVNIMDIYSQAVKLLGCNYNDICEQLERNWITLF
jgi:TatD DNase family protein